MIDKETFNRVKGWEARSRTDKDPFSKFTFLWNAFEAALKGESQMSNGRQMIDWLKQAIANNEQNNLVQAYLFIAKGDPFKKDIRIMKGMCPLINTTRRGAVTINDIDDHDNVVEALYFVRNNYFHAGKSPNNSRDQQWVTIAGRVLGKWVAYYVRRVQGF